MAGSEGEMGRRGAVILVVEDDPNDVFFLKRALKEAGVEQAVKAVHDGEEAIRYLEGSGRYADRRRYPLPCLLLLDLKLPKRSGLEILRWLRRDEELRDLPVVMISSSDAPGERDAAHADGVEAYRVKPVSFTDLVLLARDLRARADAHCEDAEPCAGEAAE